MSHIRLSIEYVPDKGKVEKWGTIAEIPNNDGRKQIVAAELSSLAVGTIVRVVKLP